MIKPQAFYSSIDVKQFFEALLALCGTKANPLRLGTVLIAIAHWFRELRPMTS